MVKQAGAMRAMDGFLCLRCKERMNEMKFNTSELDKYLPMSTAYKLDHICVMLEMIVDGMSHPHVILPDPGNTSMRSQGVTREYLSLEEKYRDLKEKLWWHSTDDKPPLETVNCSVDVVLIQDGRKHIAYYNYGINKWVGYGDTYRDEGKWCYIPEERD